jgi:hypothetical protein
MDRKIINDQILKETAKELGLTVKEVKEVVDAQSQYVKFIIENGMFDSVRLPNLGAFVSKPVEIQMLEHLKGMTIDQQREFKKLVRTGKVKLKIWK